MKIHATGGRKLSILLVKARRVRPPVRAGPHHRRRMSPATDRTGGSQFMSKSTAERAEISRQNGRKSKGPRSHACKQRSKFNALKHGLYAKVPVLPGEDPQQFQNRLDTWSADLVPANELEQSLVERAVTLTWQLDRAARAEAARLTTLIRSAPDAEALRQQDQAAALGQRLLFDRCGPVPLYPHALYYFPARPRISCSGQGDDPDDPARLLR